MTCSWRRLTLGFILLWALFVHFRHLFDPWEFSGDARQHVFWTYRFSDPELFPGDPLVAFISSPRFDPPGYVALYATGARLLDALLFSKILGFVLAVSSGWLAFRVGRRLGGGPAGFLLAVLVGVFLFDEHRGGLPRSFGYPVLLLHLDALIGRRVLVGGISVVLAALLYPPLIPVMVVLGPVWLRPGSSGGAPAVSWRRVAAASPLGLVALAVVGQSYLGWLGGHSDDGGEPAPVIGPLVTAEQARAMPEFHLGGRAEFWHPDWVTFWLGDWGYNRSACGLLSSSVFYVFVGVLGLIAWRRRRFAAPLELVALFAAGLLLFLLAHATLFALFQPSRYPMYAWPVALASLVAVNLGAAAARILDKLRGALRGWRGLATFVVLLAVIVAAKSRAPGHRVKPGERAMIQAVAALPRDAVIAGVPGRLNDLPLLARRSVYLNKELALPWYTDYAALVRRRYEVTIAILTARGRDEIRRLAAAEGITHLLIDRSMWDQRRPLFAPPFEEWFRRRMESVGVPWLSRGGHGFREVHGDDARALLEL